jgi:hypothetical protein
MADDVAPSTAHNPYGDTPGAGISLACCPSLEMTAIAGRFVIDGDDDRDWYRVIVCAIKMQRNAR